MSEPGLDRPVDDRSPEAIERDIERDRAALDQTLNALSGRLSPGRLMDMALSNVRHNLGADFLRSLRDSIRDNPVPVAVTAIGLFWLMAATNRSAESGRSGHMMPAMRRHATPATEEGVHAPNPAAEPLPTGPEDDPAVAAPVVPPAPGRTGERHH